MSQEAEITGPLHGEDTHVVPDWLREVREQDYEATKNMTRDQRRAYYAAHAARLQAEREAVEETTVSESPEPEPTGSSPLTSH